MPVDPFQVPLRPVAFEYDAPLPPAVVCHMGCHGADVSMHRYASERFHDRLTLAADVATAFVPIGGGISLTRTLLNLQKLSSISVLRATLPHIRVATARSLTDGFHALKFRAFRTSPAEAVSLSPKTFLLQTSPFTCQPTSILNGVLALRREVPMALAESTITAAHAAKGMSMAAALERLGGALSDVGIAVASVGRKATGLAKPHHSVDELWELFAGRVGRDSVGLVGVKFKPYNGGAGRHAIAVTGTGRSAQGERMLQILDPEIGEFWVRLTDFARVLDHAQIHLMTRV